MKVSNMVTYTCLVFLALSGSVYAADPTTGTGNELIKICSESNYQAQNSDWSYCVAYVDGVTDGYAWSALLLDTIVNGKNASQSDKDAYNKLLNLLKEGYCPPANVTREQMALVVRKYLADNPEILNQLSADLVISAVAKAWPCDKK